VVYVTNPLSRIIYSGMRHLLDKHYSRCKCIGHIFSIVTIGQWASILQCLDHTIEHALRLVKILGKQKKAPSDFDL